MIITSCSIDYRNRDRRQWRRAALLRVILTAFCLHIASFPLYADSLTVSGDPGTLVINTATAGSQPTSATNPTCCTSTATRSLTGFRRTFSIARNISCPPSNTGNGISRNGVGVYDSRLRLLRELAQSLNGLPKRKRPQLKLKHRHFLFSILKAFKLT